MLHQLYNFSRSHPFIIAVSGGVDSMAITDFYHRGQKNFELAYFHHNTPQADEMQECVSKWAKDNKRTLHIGSIGNKERPKEKSPEEFWRLERFSFLTSLGRDIATAHHLDDAMETFLFRSINGHDQPLMHHISYTSKLLSMNVRHQFHHPNYFLPGVRSLPVDRYHIYIYHPLLTTLKQELIDWAVRHNVPWVEDKSNADVSSPRNRIRHNILPEILKVNPGFAKVIKKKVLEQVK